LPREWIVWRFRRKRDFQVFSRTATSVDQNVVSFVGCKEVRKKRKIVGGQECTLPFLEFDRLAEVLLFSCHTTALFAYEFWIFH